MARAFNTTSKKLVLPFFALFEIGWIVYSTGFIPLLAKSNEDLSIKHPLYFPYYMILIGGQFVALLGILHAALPSGRINSIIGALFTILNIIYFVSVGYVITCTFIVTKWGKYFLDDAKLQADYDPQSMQTIKLMFAGSILLIVSWGLIQLVSCFYERPPQPTVPVPTRNLLHVVIECWKNRTILVGDTSESVRLFGILAMLFSAVGWVIFMGGLFNMNIMALTYLLCGWSAVFITPFMYFVSLFHAGCTGNASTVLGIFASILNTFFIVGMGFSVTLSCALFFYPIPPKLAAEAQLDVEEIKRYCRIMLGGAVVCLIFWTVVLLLWPFYHPQGTACHVKNKMNFKDYGYHPLLPVSLSVTENTESRENMQQVHLDQYCTEAEATSH